MPALSSSSLLSLFLPHILCRLSPASPLDIPQDAKPEADVLTHPPEDEVVREKEGTLVLAGFLGRGNAGDEAMLQVLFEAFSPRFDIVISVDKNGAYAGFEGWYPYAEAKVVHQNDCNVTERIADPVGVLVGGGSLSLGFAAGQVFVARSQGLPVALAGVDVWQPDASFQSPQRAALSMWLGLFDQKILRTSRSVAALHSIGMRPMYGADWALLLPMDEAADIVPDEQRALVVLREGPPDAAGNDFKVWSEELLGDLEARGYKPVLVPFSPEDERFLATTGLDERVAVERCWWNARRIKQLIANSALTVTVGRLHPMIFAAPTKRNLAVLRPPHWTAERAGSMEKLIDMADDLGIDVFDTKDAFTQALSAGTLRPADPERVTAALGRVGAALETLHTLFQAKR